MTAGDTPGRVFAARGAVGPMAAGGDIIPFAPSVAITYVFITPRLTFPPSRSSA